MARRHKRTDNIDKARILKAIGEARDAIVAARGDMIIRNPIYATSSRVMEAIDDLAGLLTGDRTHFHLRGHGMEMVGSSMNHRPFATEEAAPAPRTEPSPRE